MSAADVAYEQLRRQAALLEWLRHQPLIGRYQVTAPSRGPEDRNQADRFIHWCQHVYITSARYLRDGAPETRQG